MDWQAACQRRWRVTDVTDIESAKVALAAKCSKDPEQWARKAYDWGNGELKDYAGPRQWQTDVLGDIRDHLSNEKTRFQPLMLAVASGHGIGKSACIGMIVNWAISTCDDCKVIITANTDTQLRTKTSPEVGKWQRMALTANWFDVQSTSVASRDKPHTKTCRREHTTSG